MNKQIDKYIDSLLESTPTYPLWNIEIIKGNKKTSWNYIDGCMLSSLIELYKITNDKKYFNFVKNFIDYFVNDDGTIKTYEREKYALDDICESRILFDVYQICKEEKYQKAIEFTAEQIKNQPRTKEGNFIHKAIYPNQVWLDGIYMVMPFYTRLGEYEDIIKQLKNVRNIMFDEKKLLYYHGYDSSKQMFWANKQTGLSKSFWLRSIGWLLVGLVDVYDYSNNEQLKKLTSSMLKEGIEGILNYQDSESKMFYQVVDQGNRPGNYLETSGSLMVAYACLKGARLRILDPKYHDIGNEIFNGVIKKYLSDKNGNLNLGGICIMAGLGPNDKLYRDGTFEYYISEKVVENDAKGVGPLIMAYVETLK